MYLFQRRRILQGKSSPTLKWSMSPKRAVTGGGEGDNGVRGTNATLKPKHARLAAEISTLRASMCTVARTEA